MSQGPDSGVLEVLQKGGGFLRDPGRSFAPDHGDIFVPQKLIQKLNLSTGAMVAGAVGKGPKGPVLESVATVCGLPPAEFADRIPLKQLTALNPEHRFHLGKGGNVSMRIIDLIAPIARGTRGLIVSPPKAGKTTLLENLATAIHEDAPETRIVVLLIDERPEEVTHFRRSTPAEVLASSSDQSIADHVRLAQMSMSQVVREVECHHDVVVLLDSITRMGRAFNQSGRGSGRTMSGGLDSRALEIPRKFFGMARNVEGGGSLTVIATALVDTGSRMDDMIFEEFKGTGNSEIVLDRNLAENRIYPAIDLRASGTRRDELFFNEEEFDALTLLRRRAVAAHPKPAMEGMLKLMEKYDSNEALLAGISGE
ncbi:MAG: transcription termination factor Rho [Candidatus Krumholzibacteria bacterium]|nr:transcription termination factor Rho [Candidatus Krumholzibacteria bacterium]